MKPVHAGDALVPAGKRNEERVMTAEATPRLERQVRAQGGYQQMVRRGIVLAAMVHMLLHDRRVQVAAITAAIGAVSLAELIRNSEARPMRRATSWYWGLGGSRELPGTGQVPEAGKRSRGQVR
jgi:hypothetical protein